MIKVSLSAFSDEAGSSLAEQIDALHRNGVTYTELRNVDGKNVKDLTEQEARDIHAKLSAAGIRVWALGSPLGKVDISVYFEEYLEVLRHLCRLCRIFETDKIRMFSFFGAYEEKDRVIAYLRRMVDVAAEYGVTLCHENEKKIYGDVADRVVELLDAVPGLASVYDPANFLQDNELPEKTLPLLHARSTYFHIKDVIVATGELVPAGYGDGAIDRLIAMIDRDTVLTVEPHLKVFAGYAQIDGEEMKNKFHFESNGEAFDAAIAAIKKLLCEAGYVEQDGCFVK